MRKREILLVIVALFLIFTISTLLKTPLFKSSKKFNSAFELEKAVELFNKNEFSESSIQYKKILQEEPDNYLATLGLAESYRKLGLTEQAIERYNDSLKSNYYDFRVFLGLGNAYFDLGDYEKSLFYFEKAYQIKPNKQVLLGLIAVLNRLVRYNQSIILGDQYVSKFGASSNLYRHMAVAYFFKGNFSNALDLINRSVRTSKNYHSNYLIRGFINLAQNNTIDALNNFLKAAELKKTNSAFQGISIAYAILGEEEQSTRYRNLASLYKSDGLSLRMLGSALLRTNHLDLALYEFNLSSSDKNYLTAEKRIMIATQKDLH